MSFWIERFWYTREGRLSTFAAYCLWPLSLFYQWLSICRRFFLKKFCLYTPPVPLIVVGNLSLGGVGKTPLVIALAQELKKKGLRVGIVSRGYGAKVKHFPYAVSLGDEAALVGDEPLLIKIKTACPVVIAPNRVQAVQYLLKHHASEIILSDDGLQHYALGRSLEIVVIDGLRQLGNGFCLPAGPLREGKGRLKAADFVVVNEGTRPGAYTMQLCPSPICSLLSGEALPALSFSHKIAAVAGIGHPQRFFALLTRLNILFKAYPFPDHHVFTKEQLELPEQKLLMTEKDAVKCRHFAKEDWYVLPVEARLDENFWKAFWSHPHLQGLI